MNNFSKHDFSFDKVFNPKSRQEEVYKYTVKPALKKVFEGYNSTVLAYGQTGSGKTFTMEGELPKLDNGVNWNNFKQIVLNENSGMIARAIKEIFDYVQENKSENSKFIIKVSYFQIYTEIISDLLKPERKNLQIREDKHKGVFVENLSEWVISTPNEIFELLKQGTNLRKTAPTKINDVSSRSHAVFILALENIIMSTVNNKQTSTIRQAKLNLIGI